MPDDSYGQGAPRGFTILELLIVISLIAVLLAMTLPNVLRYVGEQPIREQAHEVAMALRRCRTKAIDAGADWQFRFEPNGRRYIVLPLEAPAESSVPRNGAEATTSTAAPPTESAQLSAELSFEVASAANSTADGEQAAAGESLPDALLQLLPAGMATQGSGWSRAIVFHADGSSDDAVITLLDADSRRIRISVRGLIGDAYQEEMTEGAEL